MRTKASGHGETRLNEFQVPDRNELARPRPGMKIVAGVRKQGSQYALEQIGMVGASAKE
jgi:hypothetical protein